MSPRKRTVVMISGRGSNLAALLNAASDRAFPAEIVGVISDRADAPGLKIAQSSGIPAQVFARQDFADKAAHDAAIDGGLAGLGAELVCLAGYMRLFTTPFVEKWRGRMINIHPALLPAFKGLDSHAKALEAGVRVHGCTVHFVTPQMDDGPIVAQAAVPVLLGDTEDRLSARVLKAEHHLYPLALRLVAEGKARIEGSGTVFTDVSRIEENAAAFLSSPSSVSDDVDLEHLARITP